MSPGNGRVLVVDGGGSLRCALMGDMLGNIAIKNGWAVRGWRRWELHARGPPIGRGGSTGVALSHRAAPDPLSVHHWRGASAGGG
jgi:hypothetical protein